jgi:hypothetical protein
MRVNPSTLLFEDLTDKEAAHLVHLAETVLFASTPPSDAYIEAWLKAACPEPHQRLLHLATLFPARALLSVVRRSTVDTLTLAGLFQQGDVAVHNVGPDFVMVDFLPEGGDKVTDTRRGEGTDLTTALANLR